MKNIGRRGFTRQPENPNVHISGPRKKERTLYTKRAKQWREREKSANFRAPHPSGPTPRGPLVWGPTPHVSGFEVLSPSGSSFRALTCVVVVCCCVFVLLCCAVPNLKNHNFCFGSSKFVHVWKCVWWCRFVCACGTWCVCDTRWCL